MSPPQPFQQAITAAQESPFCIFAPPSLPPAAAPSCAAPPSVAAAPEASAAAPASLFFDDFAGLALMQPAKVAAAASQPVAASVRVRRRRNTSPSAAPASSAIGPKAPPAPRPGLPTAHVPPIAV